jgi:hypothetical protein
MLPEIPPSASTILARIAGLPVGWHLANNAAWQSGGDDPEARLLARKALEELYADGRLERMFVFCHGRPQACYLIDGHLRELDEVAS